MTQIELEPYVFWSIVALALNAFVIFPIFLVAVTKQEQPLKWREKLGLQDWPWLAFAAGATLWLTLLLLLFGGLIFSVIRLVSYPIPDSQDYFAKWDFNFFLAGLAALTATTGAVIAVPFTFIRLRIAGEANLTAEQGLITDRINKAVEGLGAFRTVSKSSEKVPEANVEVRCGSVISLRRIAEDSPRDHAKIVELLEMYVCNNACSTSSSKENNVSIANKLPRTDIRLALQWLSSQSDKESLDFRGTNFSKTALASLKFTSCDFRGCAFSSAFLVDMNFTGSFFALSDFSDTRSKSCSYRGSMLTNITCTEGTSFKSCDFTGALVHQSDFSNIHLTQEQLDSIYADATVAIPVHLRRPKHWSKKALSLKKARLRWKSYKTKFGHEE